jgi:hypothetical protein
MKVSLKSSITHPLLFDVVIVRLVNGYTTGPFGPMWVPTGLERARTAARLQWAVV